MAIQTVLLDADIPVYALGYASETSEYETEDHVFHPTLGEAKKHIQSTPGLGTHIEKYTEAEPVSHALRLASNLIKKVKEATGAEEVIPFLTGGNNFRVDVATIQGYKANRTQDKPLHYNALRQYFIDRGAIVTDGHEADDAMGMCQREDTCIASTDKDMNMIPGEHYNWTKDKLYTVTEMEGIRWFYTQMLTGDNADNILGCYGIGPVRAQKILSGLVHEEDLFWKVLEVYNDHYERPWEALRENGQLLWIMREDGKIWEPPF
jgi:5'-3' exonuclease